MYWWLVNFDLIAERVTEGDEWLEKVGLKFWSEQECVTRVSLFKHALTSTPRRTLVIETTSMDTLQKILGSSERLSKRSEFEKYVKNETSITWELKTSVGKD
ncbi:MAG: hypothetical protein JSV25_09485 [Spirochaetota bacterium]|nr:MAG: hypothetical protein JSV25_09485 [Spirochaetota bacterium]